MANLQKWTLRETTHKSPDPSGCTLSAREADILRSVMEGASRGTIASEFGVSERTVRDHVKSILKKVQVMHSDAVVSEEKVVSA
ncbi:helix-turn-helix domain-containing protein [Microvirga lenta]|uniref:helix-turn-helix domain-containing protein n=1 Tax=Microvirga lenta TaxID=2881337 RepID=UPI001CFFBFE0|nr:helix-turn-helix transcriptional regulator [Microvirga lenta]MCB5175854.1 helix-turn-helix transcriptional regulator [Microvirga lenta]